MVVLDKFLLHSALLIIIFAYILDLLLGDPKWLPHPVRWIGRYITFLEDKIKRFADTPLSEKIGGVFFFLIVVGGVFWFNLVSFITHHSPLSTHHSYFSCLPRLYHPFHKIPASRGIFCNPCLKPLSVPPLSKGGRGD